MKKVFVIQPYTEQGEAAYQMVSQAVALAGAQAFRLSDLQGDPGLEKLLEITDLVICDVSVATPNLMYELGFVFASSKPVILISQTLNSLPIDIRSRLVLRYDLVSLSGESVFIYELQQAIVGALDDPQSFLKRPSTSQIANKVFISYSHRDQEFLQRLMVHLKPLQRAGNIDLWSDVNLTAGDDWKRKIKLELDRARTAILLISADFLASDFIVENELPPLLQQAEVRGTRIIPVILKPCRFRRDKHLARFQAINDPLFPLACLSESDQEAVYDRIAETVESSLMKNI